MNETIKLGDVDITIIRKNIKRIHLSVYPPDGRVVIATPNENRLEVIRAYAVAQLSWIKKSQKMFMEQARETEREFITRESHYLWGKRYLLNVVEHDAKPMIQLDYKTLTLYVRPQSSQKKKAQIVHDWHKKLLHMTIPPLIEKWQKKLDVTVKSYFLQRMKTKWGNCNADDKTIRLNTELVKKPRDLLEYVIVHEMLHFIEPNHSDRFFELLTTHYPHWKDARRELNALPLAKEVW